MQNAIFSAATSTSAIYGNVAAAMKDYLINLFPENYFSYTHISSEISYKAWKKYTGNNNKENMQAKHRPFLYIQPEYTGGDTDLFLANTPMVTNFDGYLNGAYDTRYLSKVLRDTEKGYQLRFKMNHDRIEYTCRIQVDTLNEALDLNNNLRNALTWDKTLYYRTSLESIIPRSIMGLIGKLSDIDINAEDNHYTTAFLSRLNKLSTFPITYKIKNASQKDEFFLYYDHNLLVTFTDLSKPSASRIGMLDGFYEFNFRVTVEFNFPATYYLESVTERLLGIDVNLVDVDVYRGTQEIIPLFTIRNLFAKYPPFYKEYSYYANFIFTIEDEKKEKDELNIGPIFQDDTEDLDNYHVFLEAIHKGEVYTPYIKFFILKDRVELVEHVDYEFDMSTMKLFIKTLEEDATYRCIVYLNLGMINTRKIEYIESKKKEKSKL